MKMQTIAPKVKESLSNETLFFVGAKGLEPLTPSV